MSRDFILFLVRKALWEGRVFRTVRVAEHLEERVAVDPASVTFVAGALSKFSEHEGRQDVALVAAVFKDADGHLYDAHLNAEFDKLLTEFGQEFVFKGEDLTPLANS